MLSHVHYPAIYSDSEGLGAVVNAAWKVGDRGFEPHSGYQVLKKQHVSSPLTRNDAILWGASVTEK